RGDARGSARMGGAAARPDRIGVPGEGDRLPRRDGGPRTLRQALPRVRSAGPAHRLRRERNQLLRALPDRRTDPRRPRAVAIAEEELAALDRRAGMKATFSFDPELRPFLDRLHRQDFFEYGCARAATLKNAIEALGVPHTEVGAVRVNGEPATLQRIV